MQDLLSHQTLTTGKSLCAPANLRSEVKVDLMRTNNYRGTCSELYGLIDRQRLERVGKQTEIRFTLKSPHTEQADNFTDRSENEEIHGDLHGVRG